MIDAGLPLVQCLEILGANQENAFFQKTLTSIRTTVEGGSTLANAMRLHPKVFDDLATNMIEAGETGVSRLILQRIAAYVEKAVKLKSAVKSALIYPIAVVGIAILVVGALLSSSCPSSPTSSLGWAWHYLPTRITVGLSKFVANFWWFFMVGGVGVFVGIKQACKIPE